MTVTLWDAIFEDADRMPFGASATEDKHTPGAVDVVLDDYAGTFSRLSLAIRAAKAAAKRRGMTLVTEALTKYAPTNLSLKAKGIEPAD